MTAEIGLIRSFFKFKKKQPKKNKITPVKTGHRFGRQTYESNDLHGGHRVFVPMEAR